MNIDKINRLADYLDNLPETEHFDQREWYNECGAPSCMAGHAVKLFRPELHLDADSKDCKIVGTVGIVGHPLTVAAEILDLNMGVADRLFLPNSVLSFPTLNYSQYLSSYWSNPYLIDNHEAAKILRYLVKTGQVDFFTPLFGGADNLTPDSIKAAIQRHKERTDKALPAEAE